MESLDLWHTVRPYFLPRTWKKYTKEDCIKAAKEAMSNDRLVKKTFDEWVEHYKNYRKAVPKKVGFNFVELGWKTKWTDKDIRFEWSPIWSFVFFGYQVAIIFSAPHRDHYWESFLFYQLHTDKTKSKKDRLKECREKFPNIWKQYKNGKEEVINYYDLILKPKYK